MKNFIFLVFPFLFFQVHAAEKNARPGQPTEVPSQAATETPREVWVVGFDEYAGLRSEQKNEWLKQIVQLSKKNSVVKAIDDFKTQKSLAEALADEARWEKVEARVTQLCDSPNNKKACAQIDKVRGDVLMKFRAHE